MARLEDIHSEQRTRHTQDGFRWNIVQNGTDSFLGRVWDNQGNVILRRLGLTRQNVEDRLLRGLNQYRESL